jgi:ASC-1-like (ASCH) protein
MTPRVHRLKVLDVYWGPLESGEKPFEVRWNDREFQRGDHLEFVKVDRDGIELPCILQYRTISYVLTGGRFGIEAGWVVLGLAPIGTAAL